MRKEFKPLQKKDKFELELRNLSILKLLKHPNIIELLGSYTYRDKHNFIFPLARGGSLADLFKGARPPALQSDDHIILALSGLCSAVRVTHDLFSEDGMPNRIGCHHDLKPQNVLVDDAEFLLADFGLSRFKEHEEGSATSPRSVGGCYVAPECQDISASNETQRTRVIGRASDIWSLGCIMMETLVYMKSGARGVGDFEVERSYRVGQFTYHLFHHGPNDQEPAVATCLTRLENIASTNSERLLINLIRNILQLDPDARPKAQDVERSMWFIAIDTIAQQVRLQFDFVWDESSSRQAFIEAKQFESWMESCEILYTHRDSSLSYHWNLPSYSEYQSTLECLKELRDTLDTRPAKSQDRSIYHLIERLNDFLMNALPKKLQENSRRNLELKVLGTGAQHSASQALGQSHGHERNRISMLETIKEMSSLVTERRHSSRPDLWIEVRRLEGQDSVGIHHKSALVNDSDGDAFEVLCEVKSYSSDRLEESIRLQLHLRLEATAELLQKAVAGSSNGFRVLNCLGYFHDPAKLTCGLVYHLPTSKGSERLDVSTLRTVLAEQQGLPFLGSRFRLARNLAMAVLEFHKVGWLHKSVSSMNIVFVYPKGSSWGKSVDCPYLLGFSNSRPEGQDPYSTWLYETNRALMDSQHPEYLKHEGRLRYRPEFDYYSLGMVLLEIGHWKPLNKIIAKIPGNPEDLLNHLRRKQVPELGFTMGITYRNVVDACLSGDFGKPRHVDESSNSSTNVILRFATTVVEQLEKCWA